MPEYLVKNSKPEFLEFSSRKKGYKRFVTDEIKEKVERLDAVEEELKKHLIVFTRFIFE